MGSKPKAPKPTAQELELQRSQRNELDDLTRQRNASLKAIKRTLGGRRFLLGSGSQRGVQDGSGGPSSRGGGGIMGSGARGAASAGGKGYTPSGPIRLPPGFIG